MAFRIAASNNALASHLKFYAPLIKAEFADRDPQSIYELAFSRLLKPDVPGSFGTTTTGDRPIMIGTDERDLFIPEVRRALNRMAGPAIRVLDIGCGDDQTFNHYKASLPRQTIIDLVDPNQTYMDAYQASAEKDGLSIGRRWNEEFLNCQNAIGETYDLILLLHSIYFTGPIDDLLAFISSRLNDGGTCMLVFADEVEGYTGRMVEDLLLHHENKRGGERAGRLERRHALLCQPSAAGLSDFGLELISSARQDSKLYGHDMGDMIAFAFITELPFETSKTVSEKVDCVAERLLTAPEMFSLALETDGARAGMISVSEPQFIVQLSKS